MAEIVVLSSDSYSDSPLDDDDDHNSANLQAESVEDSEEHCEVIDLTRSGDNLSSNVL